MISCCLSPRFCNFHHCFIELPLHLSHNIYDHTVALVEWNCGRVYLWALFQILPDADICRLDQGFSTSLGLLEQPKLFITFPHVYLPHCIRLAIIPNSRDDWDVLAPETHRLSDELLEQQRIVSETFIIPFWLHTNVCIHLRIVKIEPYSEFAILQTNTEIYLFADRFRFDQYALLYTEIPSQINSSTTSESIDNFFPSQIFAELINSNKIYNFFVFFQRIIYSSRKNMFTGLDKFIMCSYPLLDLEDSSKYMPFRSKRIFGYTLNISHFRTDGYFLYLKPVHSVFPLDNFKVSLAHTNSPVIAWTSLLEHPSDIHSCSSYPTFYPILLFTDSTPNHDSNYFFSFPDLCISKSLGILLRPILSSAMKPTMITLLISQVTHDVFGESKIIEAFKKLISVLSNISLFPVRNNQEFLIDIEGISVLVVMQMDCCDEQIHSFLYQNLLECIPIDVNIRSDIQSSKMTDSLFPHQCSMFPSNLHFFGYNQLKSHSQRILKSFLSPLNHLSTNLTILVTGENVTSQIGTKSFVIYMLAIISDLNYKMDVQTLNCMSLIGKNLDIKLESLIEIFRQEKNSIIILYNLECLFPETIGEQNFNRNASKICQYLFSMTYRKRRFKNKLIFIATSKGKDFHLNSITCPQGKHLFHHRLVIKQPTFQDRLYILEDNIQHYFPLCSYEIDCNLLVSEFPNVPPRQYFKIIFRSIQYSVLDGNCMTIQEILRKFFSYYASNYHLKLSKYTKGFSYTLPGMDSVRKPILNILNLQLKFPRLISKLPLKNKVGILLYGMPGTGKTYLVDSLANEYCLNVFKIRGPEVLDKFIGASEDKIRQIFALARATTPSLIFFDEFDSIARCRGSQQMGVLDRVVNQLLTELDGVQEFEGVSIIATTCHPELIDTALLRPGRIGMHIKCNLPSLEERKIMIEYLINEANIDSIQANDIMAIAELTSGFSHADINSLISNYRHADVNSSLKRSHRILEKYIGNRIGNLWIPQPSLSQSDREKYEFMYHFFEKPNNSRNSRGIKITCA